MPRVDVVEVYELLKPKLGEEESRALLRFVEDRTVHLVRDEIAKGLATKEDIARLEREIWQLRLYVVAIGALIIITNPRVLDLLGKLLGIAP